MFYSVRGCIRLYDGKKSKSRRTHNVKRKYCSKYNSVPENFKSARGLNAVKTVFVIMERFFFITHNIGTHVTGTVVARFATHTISPLFFVKTTCQYGSFHFMRKKSTDSTENSSKSLCYKPRHVVHGPYTEIIYSSMLLDFFFIYYCYIYIYSQ